MSIRAILGLAIFTIAALSCSRPVSDEYYLTADKVGAMGQYVFEIDLSDSTYIYDLDAIVVMKHRGELRCKDVPMIIAIDDMGRREYSDTLSLGMDNLDMEDFFTKSLFCSLVESFRPDSYSNKTVIIRLNDKAFFDEVDGIGIRVTRK